MLRRTTFTALVASSLLAGCYYEKPEPPTPEPTPVEAPLSYYERHDQCELLPHERKSIYVQFVRLSDLYGEDVARNGTAEGHRITTECLDLIVMNAMLDNPEWTPTP